MGEQVSWNRQWGSLIGDKFIGIDAGGGGDLLANGDSITETESPTDIMELVSKYAFGGVDEEEEE